MPFRRERTEGGREGQGKKAYLRGPSLEQSDGVVEPFLARLKVWHRDFFAMMREAPCM